MKNFSLRGTSDISLSLLLTLTLFICVEGRAFSQAITEPSNEFNFPQIGDVRFLYVPVTAAGKDLTMIVDTGAEMTFIDAIHKDILGPAVQQFDIADPFGRSESVFAYRIDKLNLFGVKTSDMLVMEGDLSTFRNHEGAPIDGILGNDFLKSIGLGYDHAKNSVYFGRSAQRHFKNEFDLDNSGGTPKIGGIEIGGVQEEIKFIIDTGDQAVLSIPSETFDELSRRHKIHSLELKKANTLIGDRYAKAGRIANAKIWGVEFTDVPVSEGNNFRLGLSLLRRFDFYIDFEARRMGFNSSSATNLPFEFSTFGFYVVYENFGMFVHDVVSGSPADTAGLKESDLILAVNGNKLDASSMRSFLRARRKPPHVDFSMTILRNGVVSEHRIQPYDYANSTAR